VRTGGAISWKIGAIALAFGLLAAVRAADAQLYQEDFRVVVPTTQPQGLEALIVRPDEPGRFPLAIISHGSLRPEEARKKLSPLRFLPQAREFARRGWATVIVLRKGYGDSGGQFVELAESCDRPNPLAAARFMASELGQAIAALGSRPDVDLSRIVVIGQSVGGMAGLALASDPPAGLAAVINFAGGRGGRGNGEVCGEEKVVEALRLFGRDSRVPTLWIYVDNDRMFPSKVGKRWHAEFTNAGGRADFIAAPAFGTDGHDFFGSARATTLWTGYVDNFLRRYSLQPRPALLRSPASKVIPPPEIPSHGHTAFSQYVHAAPHKALAVSPAGSFVWHSGARTIEEAKEAALKRCFKPGQTCRIRVVDDDVVK